MYNNKIDLMGLTIEHIRAASLSLKRAACSSRFELIAVPQRIADVLIGAGQLLGLLRKLKIR